MIKHLSTIECNSELYPGVSFRIRPFSHGLRSKVRLDLVKPSAKIREHMKVINDLIEESGIEQEEAPANPSPIIEIKDAPDQKAEKESMRSRMILLDKVEAINNEVSIITATEVDPVYLKASFVSISGIELEGFDKIGWEELYHNAPEDLCREIINRIKAEAGLQAYQKENLELPTTSGAAVDGQIQNSIVPNASAPDIIANETATNTSPKT